METLSQVYSTYAFGELDALVFGTAGPAAIWDAVRPAVIAADPIYAGDEAGFCDAYGANAYAPDLRR